MHKVIASGTGVLADRILRLRKKIGAREVNGLPYVLDLDRAILELEAPADGSRRWEEEGRRRGMPEEEKEAGGGGPRAAGHGDGGTGRRRWRRRRGRPAVPRAGGAAAGAGAGRGGRKRACGPAAAAVGRCPARTDASGGAMGKR